MKTSTAILVSSFAMIIAWFLCPAIITITGGGISFLNPIWFATYYNQEFRFLLLPGYFNYFQSILIYGPSLIFVPEVARLLRGKSSLFEGIIVALLSISPLAIFLIGPILLPIIPTPCVLLVGVLCLMIFKSRRFSNLDETTPFIDDEYTLDNR